MSYYVTAITDPPHKKGQNQDSVIVQKIKTTSGKEAILSVVCDGMGELGQIASASIATAFSEWFQDFCNSEDQNSTESIQKSWDIIIKKATKRLFQKLGGDSGATVAVFLVVGEDWYMTNVGDVRVYEVTKSGVKQISTDHTYAAREVALGHMEPSEAVNDPKAFYVFQSLGKTKDIISSSANGQIEPSASYIVCTGGFYHQYKMSTLYRELSPIHVNDSNADNVLVSMIQGKATEEDASIVLLLSSEESEKNSSSETTDSAKEPEEDLSLEYETYTELDELFDKSQDEKGGEK